MPGERSHVGSPSPWLRWLVCCCVCLTLGLALSCAHCSEMILEAMMPEVTFAASSHPTAPDYSELASWAAHLESSDAADVAIPALQATDQHAAPVDVFYLHSTSYLGSEWNGPIDDAELNATSDRNNHLIQASAFNACCAVYGPRYRQAHGSAFTHPSADGARAIELAYGDVAAAFRYFIEHLSKDRPFILAAHSQGSVMGIRLLREEIAPGPLRQRLVAAYLIGAPIAAERAGVPVCGAPEQTGCVVSYNARGPRYVPNALVVPGDDDPLCVNPISWRSDEALAPAAHSQGALFLHAGDNTVLKGFASAQCKEGTLEVAQIGEAPRDLPSWILDRMMGPENYHPIEYQMFYVDLRRNAQARVAAYLTAPSTRSQRGGTSTGPSRPRFML